MYTKNSHWITLVTMVAVVGLLPFSSVACENFFTEPFGAPLTPSAPSPTSEPPPKEEPKQPTITYKKHPLELVINFDPREKDSVTNAYKDRFRISALMLCKLSPSEEKTIKDCDAAPNKERISLNSSSGFSQKMKTTKDGSIDYVFVPSLALKSPKVQSLVSTSSSTNICSERSSLFFSPVIVLEGSTIIVTNQHNRLSFEEASSKQQACTTLHVNQTSSDSGLFQIVGPENFVFLEKIVQP